MRPGATAPWWNGLLSSFASHFVHFRHVVFLLEGTSTISPHIFQNQVDAIRIPILVKREIHLLNFLNIKLLWTKCVDLPETAHLAYCRHGLCEAVRYQQERRNVHYRTKKEGVTWIFEEKSSDAWWIMNFQLTHWCLMNSRAGLQNTTHSGLEKKGPAERFPVKFIESKSRRGSEVVSFC